MSHALLGEKVDEVTNHDRRLSGVSVDSGRAFCRQRSIPEFWAATHRVRDYSIWAISAGYRSRNFDRARNDLEMGRVGHHRVEDDYRESSQRLGRIRRERPFHLHRWNAGRAQRDWAFCEIVRTSR